MFAHHAKQVRRGRENDGGLRAGKLRNEFQSCTLEFWKCSASMTFPLSVWRLGLGKASWPSRRLSQSKHNSKPCTQLNITITSKGQQNFLCGHWGLALADYKQWLHLSGMNRNTLCLGSSRHGADGGVSTTWWLPWRGAHTGTDRALSVVTRWVSCGLFLLLSGMLLDVLYVYRWYFPKGPGPKLPDCQWVAENPRRKSTLNVPWTLLKTWLLWLAH